MSQPWDRKSNEPKDAYDAFCLYRDSGWDPVEKRARKRSAVAIWGAKFGHSKRQTPGRIKRWSVQWDWVKRADAYIEHLRSVEQQAMEEALKDRAREWANRWDGFREEMWVMAQDLKAKAQQMLKFPLARVEMIQDGTGLKQEIHPAKWTFDTLARVADLVAKLGAMAAEQPADRGHLTLDMPSFKLDLSELKDEEIEAVERMTADELRKKLLVKKD